MNPNRLLLLLPVLLLSACNIDNEPLGVRRELVGDKDVGGILKKTLAAAPDDTTIAAIVNTGISPYLLAGGQKNVTSEFLIRFAKVDSAAVAGVVKQAKLILPIHLVVEEPKYYFGTVHELAAYRVTQTWREDSVTAGNLTPPYFDPAAVGRARHPSRSSWHRNDGARRDTLYLPLDSTYVQTWADDSTDVLIRSLDRGILFEFYSSESVVANPRLEVLVRRNERPDTTFRYPAQADAFVFQREAPVPADRFFSGNGEKHQTYLHFTPLDSMPGNATINRAILTLNIDREHSAINQDHFTCSVFLVDAILDSNQQKGDTLYYRLLANVSGTRVISAEAAKFEVDLTGSVQSWVTFPESNKGLTIEPIYFNWDLQRVAFHSQASNPALAPRLTVDFTTPPEN